MQDLMMQGMQHKLQQSCFRCKKNTLHIESNHILQLRNTWFSLLIDLDIYIYENIAKHLGLYL